MPTKRTTPFRHDGDALAHHPVGLRAANGLAVEPDHLTGDRQEAHDGAQERRFAGAVGADQRDGLALMELGVDAVERLEIAVARDEPVGGQNGGGANGRHASIPI